MTQKWPATQVGVGAAVRERHSSCQVMALLSEKLDLKHALRFKRSAVWEKLKSVKYAG